MLLISDCLYSTVSQSISVWTATQYKTKQITLLRRTVLGTIARHTQFAIFTRRLAGDNGGVDNTLRRLQLLQFLKKRSTDLNAVLDSKPPKCTALTRGTSVQLLLCKVRRRVPATEVTRNGYSARVTPSIPLGDVKVNVRIAALAERHHATRRSTHKRVY